MQSENSDEELRNAITDKVTNNPFSVEHLLRVVPFVVVCFLFWIHNFTSNQNEMRSKAANGTEWDKLMDERADKITAMMWLRVWKARARCGSKKKRVQTQEREKFNEKYPFQNMCADPIHSVWLIFSVKAINSWPSRCGFSLNFAPPKNCVLRFFPIM